MPPASTMLVRLSVESRARFASAAAACIAATWQCGLGAVRGAGALFLLAAVLGGHALRRLRADLADVADPERRAAALERLHAYVAAREAKRQAPDPA